MNIPDEKAMYAITGCLCKTFRAKNGIERCFDCPLHKIKIEHDRSICALYIGSDEERLKLLRACIKNGNAAMFKDLPPEYRQFMTRTATVV